MKEKPLTYKCIKDTPTGSYKAGVIYNDAMCAEFPEYFAPFRFTAHDGVNIYANELYFALDESKEIYTNHAYYGGSYDDGLFRSSTREAAQAHIDEQNKPKFEVTDLVKSDRSLIYITSKTEWGVYGYGFNNEKWSDHIGICHELLNKATRAEWEAALIKEAERRGFDKCKKVSRDYLEKNKAFRVCKIVDEHGGFDYYSDGGKEALSYNWVQIYWNGKWASIIQEPERETDFAIEWGENMPFCKGAVEPLKLYLSQNNLIITKKPTQ